MTASNGKKVCALVNRSMEVRVLKLGVPPRARHGTVLDGELVGKDFLVYDAVMINGEDCSQKDLLTRIDLFTKFCSGVMRLASDPVRLVPKNFERLENARHYIEEVLPNVGYPVDGIILTPVNEPVRIGTHETMFKWKPQEKNTVDFQVRWEPRGVWGLYIQDKGLLYFQSELTPEQAPDWLRPDMIVECEYQFKDYPLWWKPILHRKDKTYPNNRRTFYRTLVNIQEDIQLKEFTSLT